MFKLDLEKSEEPEIKLPTYTGSSKKQESYRTSKKQESYKKSTTSALLTTLKTLTVWITTNWKILQEMGIPDHLSCLLRNLYSGQEVTIRTRHGTTYRFQFGKRVCRGCILSSCSFNLYAEYIMQNSGLDEGKASIKISRRNINNLRYADDTTLMAENEEEIKSPLMKVKEESEKVGLNSTLKKQRPWHRVPSLHVT